MHRKLVSSVVIAAMILGLAACSKKSDETTAADAASDTTVTSEEAATGEFDVADEDVPQLDGYTLLWHDEFNGNTLNEDIWTREVREPGWTNNELQAYTDSEENSFVKDGCLVLKAIKTTDENGNDVYTSGKVNSQNKTDFMYGRVEVCAKVPEGQGLWPAAWMMPTDESFYGQWPKCGEIDIMEVLGNAVTTAYQTIHYGEPHGEQQGLINLESGSFADSYHVYVCEWEPGEMRFYIDGELTLTCNDWFSAVLDGEEQDYPAPFNQTFFVQMNLAVGGNWPGNPDATTDFDNAEFSIDYVRVYQKPEYDTNVTKPVYDAREPQEDGNYVTNGDFSDASIDLESKEDWNFLLFENGEGSAEIKDNMIEITSTAEGDVDYSVQLVFWDIPFYAEKTYRVTFDVKASEERDIITAVTAPFAEWVRYYPDTHYTVGTEWQTITYEFTMGPRDDLRGRLEFNLGKCGSIATVDITNVRVEEVG